MYTQAVPDSLFSSSFMYTFKFGGFYSPSGIIHSADQHVVSVLFFFCSAQSLFSLILVIALKIPFGKQGLCHLWPMWLKWGFPQVQDAEVGTRSQLTQTELSIEHPTPRPHPTPPPQLVQGSAYGNSLFCM